MFFASLFNLINISLAAIPSEEQLIQRVHAHLLIKDPQEACLEATLGLQQYPGDQPLWDAYILALSKAGREQEMMNAWKKYSELFPKAYDNHDLLEHIAWSVIATGANSPSPVIRVMALVGAFFSQDSRGVAILYDHLHDDNSFLRGVAVQLSAKLRDDKLRDGVLTLFRGEQNWKVRLETIKAVGSMQIAAAKPDLIALIADPKSMAEEKVAAIEALVSLLKVINRSEIEKLAKSDRAGLRLLACEAVIYFSLIQDVDLLIPLLQDSSSEVRAGVLQVLGALRIRKYQDQSVAEIAAKLIDDPDTTVSTTAAWVLTLNDPIQGQKAFAKVFEHPSRDVRILASGALGACGIYAFPLMQKVFKETRDPYIRMNLAMALIGQQQENNAACDALYEQLTSYSQERWMWKDSGPFHFLTPSDIKYAESLDENPEDANQLARLDILNILAIMKYPKAQEALAFYLEQKTWGITGLASVLLLTEGDERAVELVANLLKSPSHKVRVQAALILALWNQGGDQGEEAVAVLQDAYQSATREMKEKIIEGLGHIGSQSSIPFLVSKLDESFQSLRITAACSLLECLNH